MRSSRSCASYPLTVKPFLAMDDNARVVDCIKVPPGELLRQTSCKAIREVVDIELLSTMLQLHICSHRKYIERRSPLRDTAALPPSSSSLLLRGRAASVRNNNTKLHV